MIHRRTIGTVLMASVLATATMLLSGCDPIYQKDAPVAIQISGGRVVAVAVCNGLSVRRALIEYRRNDQAGWETVLDGTGSFPGPTFNPEAAIEGVAVKEYNDVVVENGGTISVLIVDASAEEHTAGFVADDSHPGWIQADGRTTDDPC